MAKRLIILSGPACVGKGALKAAVDMFFQRLAYDTVPIIKSRESRPDGPRPDEINIWDNPDYFRTEDEIRSLSSDSHYITGNCRGLLQALDLDKVINTAADLVFIEAYHTIGSRLKNCEYLKGISINSVFLSPISKQEILDLKNCGVNIRSYLKELMLNKLIVRTRFMGKYLTGGTVKDLVERAEDAYSELMDACNYSVVITNHDGEGNPNWNRLPDGRFIREPEGDAGRTVRAFAAILTGGGWTREDDIIGQNSPEKKNEL